MNEPLENTYFNWLCAKVLRTSGSTYVDLLRILYSTEFVWVISGDRNRLEDGRELKLNFLRESGLEGETDWYHEPVSVLEVLLAFAGRAYFQTDIPTKDWFWMFIANLELDDFRQVSESEEGYVRDILHTFVWRTYDENGYGGIFPMRWPRRDQREVEIWYQFSEYLDDQGLL